jgi:acetylornithine/N-succinyldiaminopimelate aminotransferase
LAAKYPFIREVRGAGLMIGLVLTEPAKDFEGLLREKGLIALATAETVIRFVPPLNITARQVRKAARMVDQACAEWLQTLSKPGPDDQPARFKLLKLNAD